MLDLDHTWQLLSVEEKISRGDNHLKELKSFIERWHIPGHAIDRKLEPDGRTEVYRLPTVSEPDPRLPVIAGGVIHNYWSAHNHTAVALHMAYTAIPTEAELKGIEFPLSVQPGRFEEIAEKRIWEVNPEARTIIEQVQPEHYGNPPFWWLCHLARFDRDRYLHFPYAAQGRIGWPMASCFRQL